MEFQSLITKFSGRKIRIGFSIFADSALIIFMNFGAAQVEVRK
jgi:hypothetical protein